MLIRIFLITIFTLCTSFKGNEVPVGCLKLDIMILADRSTSVNGKEQFIHDAIYTFIDKFELAEDGIKIGLITFGDLARLESPLCYNKDSLKIACNVIRPNSSNGSTNLSHAIMMSMQEIFDNGRVGVMKMVILITDGEPDNRNEVIEYSNLLKTIPGTLIWGIFVKKNEVDDSIINYDMYTPTFISNGGAEYLKKISSPNCFIDTDYNNLVEQVKKLDICS